MRESTAIKKISAANVVGKIPNPPEKGVKPLFIVIGQATGVKSYNSQYGEGFGLVGNFEAVNLDTGEAFVAPQCFLPEPYHGAMVTKLQSANAPLAVEFAFEVGIKGPGPKSTVRYEYSVKPIRPESERDPLEGMRKLLPAPEKARK